MRGKSPTCRNSNYAYEVFDLRNVWVGDPGNGLRLVGKSETCRAPSGKPRQIEGCSGMVHVEEDG